MNRFPITLLALLALTACDHGRSAAVATARPHAAQLVGETRDLWLRYKDEPGNVIPESEYPPSVRRLGPESVSVGAAGVWITTHSVFVESAGIFVRHDPGFEPPHRGDPGYEPVAPDVYWYYAPG